MAETKYSSKIFRDFVKKASKNAHNPVNDRIILEIDDITTGCNTNNKHVDSCPLIITQDYGFRQIDSMQRPEGSPMPPPLVLWAMQGGAAYVKLADMFWQGKTLPKAVISRLNQVNGGTEISYKNTYETLRIIETTEMLIGEDWFCVIMAIAGKINKEQQSFGFDGASVGNVAAGRNFVASES